MKTILILSTALVLTCAAIFVYLGETTEWASQETIDGPPSLEIIPP